MVGVKKNKSKSGNVVVEVWHGGWYPHSLTMECRCIARLAARTEDEDYDAEGEGQLKEDEESDNLVIQEVRLCMAGELQR